MFYVFITTYTTKQKFDNRGNAVCLFIMKYLVDRGFFDGKKRLKLTIVLDNCPGQNKNNIVLKLAPYLVEIGCFKKVGFLFLVRGNTKNFTDKRFNNMKNEYRKENLYTMKDLIASCNKSDYVVAEQVDWTDFFDYKNYFNDFYKKFEKMLCYQMFTSSSEDIGLGRVELRTSNLENATVVIEDIRKGSAQRRQQLIQQSPHFDKKRKHRKTKKGGRSK